MRIHSPQRSSRRLECDSVAVPVVCVVDDASEGYQAWQTLAAAGRVRLTMVNSAAEALRHRRQTLVELWVINTDLPQTSGIELCAMLRQQSPRDVICLVADEYTPETERSAWAARASMFLCKSAHAACLSEWLESRAHHPPGLAPQPTF